jgi:hypothetical protein
LTLKPTHTNADPNGLGLYQGLVVKFFSLILKFLKTPNTSGGVRTHQECTWALTITSWYLPALLISFVSCIVLKKHGSVYLILLIILMLVFGKEFALNWIHNHVAGGKIFTSVVSFAMKCISFLR